MYSIRTRGRPAGGDPMSSLWNRRSVAALLFLAGLAACDEPSPLPPPDGGGGGSTPLAIDSTSRGRQHRCRAIWPAGLSPTPIAPVQPSTATVTSFSIVTDRPPRCDVPRRVRCRVATGCRRWHRCFPARSTGRRSPRRCFPPTAARSRLRYTWTFTTRPIVHFPLDTRHSATSASCRWRRTRLGGLHAVYADSVIG